MMNVPKDEPDAQHSIEPLDPEITADTLPGEGSLPPWEDVQMDPAEPPEEWLAPRYAAFAPAPADSPPQLVRTVNLLPSPEHDIPGPDHVDRIAEHLLARARQGLDDVFAHPDYARLDGPAEAFARAVAEHQTGIPYTQPAYFYGPQARVAKDIVEAGRYPLVGQCQQAVTTALCFYGWNGGPYGDIGSGLDAQPHCASLGQGWKQVPLVLEQLPDELWEQITVGSCLFWSAPCPTTRNGVTCSGAKHAIGCGRGSGHVAMVLRKHPTQRKWQLWDTTTSFNDPEPHAAVARGSRMLWESHWWSWIPRALSGGAWLFRGIARPGSLGSLRSQLAPRGRARLLLRRRSDRKLLFRSPWISMAQERLPISWLFRALRGAPFHETIEPSFCVNSAGDGPRDNRPLLDCSCDANGNATMSWRPSQGLHDRPGRAEWSTDAPYPAGGTSPPKPPSHSPTPPAGALSSALLADHPELQRIAAGDGSLGEGAHGPAVEAIQRGLLALGISVRAGVDGDFGQRTKQAIQAFQASHALDPDGIVTRALVQALDGALAAAGR
ncbi:peptidoglycan-binding domain-containing protein [Sorangium sp. So ce1182]|uniref:peptidoglycan-binding domain-containing protein n=1 Tax=Sorangium sp. So ce1182 TaxID=3133334 RepID=UPI003F63F467